jgi:phage-related baseplate assembly protein
MGRDINPDDLTTRMRKAGVKRIDRKSPDFEVIGDNEVAALVKYNAVYGGLEDE